MEAKPEAERTTDLLAALCLHESTTETQRWIAEWILARHAEHQYMYSTSFVDWDDRPDASRKPMLELMHTYKVVAVRESEKDRIRRAWDGSWKWVEAGWRRLWRIGLLYMTKRGDGTPQETEAANATIRQLWEFGGRHQMIDEWRGLTCQNPPGTRVCRDSSDLCRTTASTTRFRYNVSLGTWFGPYSDERFLTVWWVVTALASRYQGKFPNQYMSRDMWRTKLHAVRLGRRAVSYPSGEIWLKNNFFLGDETYRHRALCHEMMHYLVEGTRGGRPRDVYNPACKDPDNDDDNNTKCYGDPNAVDLARTGDYETMKNIDNYRGWLYNHYLRWCGDWPPRSDTQPGQTYHEDPVSDEDWEVEGYEETTNVSWTLLLEVRNAMVGSSWLPF